MKPMALTIGVLLCVSVASAVPVGTTYTYKFDGLTQYSPLWNNTDGTVTWSSIIPGNQGNIVVYPVSGSYPGDKRAQINATNAERCVSSLTNYPTTTSLFNLDGTETQFRLTADCHLNFRCGWLIGIWEDGLDPCNNTEQNSETENVVTMGTTYVSMNYRVRGAGGTNSTVGGTPPTSPYLDGNACNMQLILDIDLAAGGGDGRLTLSVKNLSSGVLTSPADPNLQNVSMNLNSMDPGHTTYGNPANWSGFFIRNQRYTGGDSPINGMGYNTCDNLTLTVMPEPASFSLLVLGGLACLRRRR